SRSPSACSPSAHDHGGRVRLTLRRRPHMDEKEIRELLEHVRAGRLSRRAFMEGMLALGLTAPMVSQMFAAAGIAHAQPKPAAAPAKRGGGGLLKTLWWQAPTNLNPHFATG